MRKRELRKLSEVPGCLDIVQNDSMVYKKEGKKRHFFVADKYI